MWPVPGPDVKKSLGSYMTDKLKLSSKFLHEIGEISIKRIAEAPGSKIKDEVVAVFSSVEIRDAIKRAAKNLGGEPGHGVRHEIPNSLQSNLKTLESLSYQLKLKHPGIKRNIRFDDMTKDLVLDFNTDPDNNGAWRRVTSEQAAQMKPLLKRGNTAEVTQDELEGLLSGR